MKNLLLLAIVVLGFSAVSFGQNPTVTASSPASANIVAPIAITKTTDLVFGNIAVSATAGGTVVLEPSLAGTRTKTGGVSLPATTGTFTAAAFTVTGQSGYAYTFTVPSTATTVKNSANNTMTINAFLSNSTGILTGGTQTVYVGATLNVGSAQAVGLYSSETNFEVTVNYN